MSKKKSKKIRMRVSKYGFTTSHSKYKSSLSAALAGAQKRKAIVSLRKLDLPPAYEDEK